MIEPKPKICECGCGKRTSIFLETQKSLSRIKGEYAKFISGHNNRGKHWKIKDVSNHYVDGALGKHWKIKDTSNMRKPKSEEHIRNISKSNRGKHLGKDNPMYGVHRFGIDAPCFGKHWKLSKESIKNILGRKGKSSLEVKFEDLINQLGLPYKFVGNGELLIAKKCPDFVNSNGEKIAIEVYYRKHKQLFRGGLEKWKAERIKIFNQERWKIIFFDETEVNENSILNKLKERNEMFSDCFGVKQ